MDAHRERGTAVLVCHRLRALRLGGDQRPQRPHNRTLGGKQVLRHELPKERLEGGEGAEVGALRGLHQPVSYAAVDAVRVDP
eukprot:8754005-Pyramimonas_sp.AAC.1